MTKEEIVDAMTLGNSSFSTSSFGSWVVPESMAQPEDEAGNWKPTLQRKEHKASA